MLKIKQVVVIGLVVLLMGILFSLDIKGLVKPPAEQRNTGGAASGANTASSGMPALSLESVSGLAKQMISGELAEQIATLENSLKSAPADQKLGIEKQLAQKWNDVDQPAAGAFYYEEIAKTENNYTNWLKAGDAFTAGYQTSQDTLLQPGLTQRAIEAYQKALALNAKSLEAQTGLGIAYVSGTASPMQGIQLLLAVVKEDPKNIKANLNLGLFSMKSGQYDKAVGRFKTVLAQKEDGEVWFYLASSYESLGQKEEAITAYTKSKELAADPGLTKFVDNKILELRKN